MTRPDVHRAPDTTSPDSINHRITRNRITRRGFLLGSELVVGAALTGCVAPRNPKQTAPSTEKSTKAPENPQTEELEVPHTADSQEPHKEAGEYSGVEDLERRGFEGVEEYHPASGNIGTLYYSGHITNSNFHLTFQATMQPDGNMAIFLIYTDPETRDQAGAISDPWEHTLIEVLKEDPNPHARWLAEILEQTRLS